MKPIVISLLLALTGCQSVPEFQLRYHDLELISPKQVEAKGLKAEVDPSTGKAKVSFDYLSSQNDASVIAAMAASNALMAEKLTQALQAATELIKQGAITGGKASAGVP